MTDKEKAKAYNEVLEKAKKIINDPNASSVWKGWLRNCFLELVESEDEKMRKAIISGMTALKNQGRETFASVPINDCIAWLKKQGEQKQLYIRFGEIPTDEKSKIYRGEIEVGTENGVSVYPAFKTDEGDIVLGLSLPITKTTLYTQQHLIEYDNRPCYLVNGDYLGKDTDGQPLISNVSIIKKIDNYRVKEENQTEQEKDILEDAILDDNEDGLIAETIRYKKEKQGEQKASYTTIVKTGNGGINALVTRELPTNGCDDEQKPAEWSEEDENMLDEAIYLIRREPYCENDAEPIVDWLKSLKDRVRPKQEWSEEEIEKAAQEWDSKANFNPFYMTMEGGKPTGVKQHITTHKESFKAGVNWILNSLRPQNHWKPSEGDIIILEKVIKGELEPKVFQATLQGILEQLKKLKEE